MNRGSQEVVDEAPDEGAASMRPRFMNRGSSEWLRVFPEERPLQ